jgi:hypothetical protein
MRNDRRCLEAAAVAIALKIRTGNELDTTRSILCRAQLTKAKSAYGQERKMLPIL